MLIESLKRILIELKIKLIANKKSNLEMYIFLNRQKCL